MRVHVIRDVNSFPTSICSIYVGKTFAIFCLAQISIGSNYCVSQGSQDVKCLLKKVKALYGKSKDNFEGNLILLSLAK